MDFAKSVLLWQKYDFFAVLALLAVPFEALPLVEKLIRCTKKRRHFALSFCFLGIADPTLTGSP